MITDLTKQVISIEIDKDGRNWKMDLLGCKFLDVYRTLKHITQRFETGRIFEEDGLSATDPNTGESANLDELRELIERAKEEIETARADRPEDPLYKV